MKAHPTFHTDTLNFFAYDKHLSISYCICPIIDDYSSYLRYLHDEELQYYNTLKYEKRIKDYLIGRYCAKIAVSQIVSVDNLADILIERGFFNQPVLKFENANNIQLSITHCDEYGIAIAFPETHPMAIDLEKINPKKKTVIELQLTSSEKNLLHTLKGQYIYNLTAIWTIKEALSKVLKTGLTTPFDIFEVEDMEYADNCLLSHFKYFTQYKAVTIFFNSYALTYIYPKEVNIDFNCNELCYKISTML